MIYLYGLIRSPANPMPGPVTGVTGPVEATSLGRCWLVHGSTDSDEILPRRRHLLAHARVLEDLMQAGTLLPMRFGLFADTVAEVAAMVERSADAIEHSFDRLAGHVEIDLRVRFDRRAALDATLAADPSLRREHERLSRLGNPPHFAVAEFGRRLAETLDLRRGAVQKRLLATLRGDWRDHVLKTPGSDVEVLSVECLVEGQTVDRITARVQDEARACQDFAGGADPVVQVVGPAPPFHFVNLTLGRRDPVEA